MTLPLIVAAVAVVGLAALLVWMSRGVRSAAPPIPEPSARTLADWRRVREAALDGDDRCDWTMCACCGAPTYDPHGGCGLCGWAEGEPLDRSRAHFAAYGTIDTPEEMAGWGELPPGDEEVAVIRRIVDLSAAAPRGEDPGAAFWGEFDGLWHALEAARERRMDASRKAARFGDEED